MVIVIGTSHWPVRAHRMAGTVDLTVVAGAVLGVAAVAEATGRAAVTAASGQMVLALVLFALATTVPLFSSRRPVRPCRSVAAGVMSVALLHSLTVAGVAAQVVALHRIGRRDATPA